MFEASIPNEEQKHIFDLLTFINKGLHTFQGPLGSRKHFFVKILIHQLQLQGKKNVAFSYNKSYCITIIITYTYYTLGESMVK
jgi:hypothetical protein